MTRTMTPNYYKIATDWLNENRPFVLTSVVSLGRPFYSKLVDTAMVRLTKDKKDFELHMNTDFFATLNPEQSAAVLVHEMFHIVLKHLDEVQDHDSYPNRRALVYAHEAIINDRLVSLGYDLPDDLIYGPETVGVDCSEMTTDEAYQLFADAMEEMNQNSSGGSGDSSDETDDEDSNSSNGSDGSGTSGDSDTGSGNSDSNGNPFDGDGDPCSFHGFIDSEDGAGDDSDDDQGMGSGDLDALREKIEEAIKKAKNDLSMDAEDAQNELPTIDQLDAVDSDISDSLYDQSMDTAKHQLNGAPGEDLYTVEVSGTSENFSNAFKKILEFINPKIGEQREKGTLRSRNNWGRPNRRYISNGMRTGVYLPTREVANQEDGDLGKKANVLIALDQSGSIPRNMADLLVRMAYSIPDDLFNYRIVTFADGCVPFDPKSKNNEIARGGTSFGPIHIEALKFEKEIGEYPFVLNFTDGEAEFYYNSTPSEEQLKKWVAVDFFASSENSIPFENLKNSSSYSFSNYYYYDYFKFAENGAKEFSLPMSKYL